MHQLKYQRAARRGALLHAEHTDDQAEDHKLRVGVNAFYPDDFPK
jgi:hypothetical protein